MRHTCLHELCSVVHRMYTFQNDVHVRPYYQDTVKHVDEDRCVRHYVVNNRVSHKTSQCHNNPVHTIQSGNEWAAQLQSGCQRNVCTDHNDWCDPRINN